MKNFTNIFFFLIFARILLSCNSNKSSEKRQVYADSSTPVTATLSKDTLQNTIDTNNYSNLPFWIRGMDHSGGNGYVDTFKIDNTQFRIIHQNELFDGALEALKNNQWNRVWEFETLSNNNDYDRIYDLDGDGFNDLIFYWKWWGEVHFFDTTTKTFSVTSNYNVSRGWEIIDTSKQICCDNDYGKLMHSPVSSTLFTFKNKKRIDLAEYSMTFDPDDDDVIIVEGEVFLIMDSSDKSISIEKIIPKKKISLWDFDDAKFWKERYKKILKNYR